MRSDCWGYFNNLPSQPPAVLEREPPGALPGAAVAWVYVGALPP